VSEIRSYRSVFDLERRIYRVDRVRLNPGGVPVRGVLYFLAMLVVIAFAARLPIVGAVARVPPWYGRELALPALGAGLLALIRVEGRPFHLAAIALLRYAIGPRHLSGLGASRAPGRHRLAGELLLLPDGSEGRLRRLRYTGPGAVRRPASGKVMVLARGARLYVG
jgi:hypothetical protein